MELLNYIPTVHILGYQCHQAHPLNWRQVPSDELSELCKLLSHYTKVVLHGKWILLNFIQGHLGAVSPYDLVDDGHSLRKMVQYPGFPIVLLRAVAVVFAVCFFGPPLDDLHHVFLELFHPYLDALASDFQHSAKFDFFVLKRFHAINIIQLKYIYVFQFLVKQWAFESLLASNIMYTVDLADSLFGFSIKELLSFNLILKYESIQIFKTFVHMLLYCFQVGRNCQDLKQLIAWDEIESRKELPLFF